MDKFIIRLEGLEEKNPAQIMRIVQETIMELNDLNESSEFIDTQEREDIYDYITKAATEAGLNINKGEDITAEFRNW